MNLSTVALSVLGDAREEQGVARRPLWLIEAQASADADADADASAYADAYADAYAYASAYASAYAYADASAYASAYAYADASATQPRSITNMKDGLYAVSLSQSGRTVLRVGWFRRDSSDPDEYECVWSTVYRGEYQTRLGDVWAKGPKHDGAKSWTWGEPVPSVAHRIHIQPLARLDPTLWREVCPRPEGWEP